jgi:hypothetical protein
MPQDKAGWRRIEARCKPADHDGLVQPDHDHRDEPDGKRRRPG